MTAATAARAGTTSPSRRRGWPDYAAVWRWHFYAGLLCLPLVCWLALTGSIYLFKPDVEAWLDRPYENIALPGPRAAPSAEVAAAVKAVPGAVFSRYEPPRTPTGAAQVVVSRGAALVRVYVHPGTLEAMDIGDNDERLMELVFNLHGNFLAGDRGSMLVEIGGSWIVVMIVTGLFLWWPRQSGSLAGVVYPRLGRGRRLFWRDLHAVTGLWVSMFALFMLLSGLPWAASWGNYLTWARSLSPVTAGVPDWTTGRARAFARRAEADRARRAAEHLAMMKEFGITMDHSKMAGMDHAATPGDASAAAHAAMGHGVKTATGPGIGGDYSPLDRVMPMVGRLAIPFPVWITPPDHPGGDWVAASQVQDRPRRVKYTISDAGNVVAKQDFAGRNIVDQTVDVSVAAHEGQLFGRPNQAIALLTAAGLVMMSVSAAVLWIRRRAGGALGAPIPVGRPRFSGGLLAIILALAVLMPLFGLSLGVVAALEWLVLRRIPATRDWLGLRRSPALA